MTTLLILVVVATILLLTAIEFGGLISEEMDANGVDFKTAIKNLNSK